MEEYSVKIKDSSKELSAIERVRIKDLTDCNKIDDMTDEENFILVDLDYFAVLEVHNEKSDNKDYTKYVFVDKECNKYQSGSESLWKSFLDIYNELIDEPENFIYKFYKVPSKNYKGKNFLTCTVV